MVVLEGDECPGLRVDGFVFAEPFVSSKPGFWRRWKTPVGFAGSVMLAAALHLLEKAA